MYTRIKRKKTRPDPTRPDHVTGRARAKNFDPMQPDLTHDQVYQPPTDRPSMAAPWAINVVQQLKQSNDDVYHP